MIIEFFLFVMFFSTGLGLYTLISWLVKIIQFFLTEKDIPFSKDALIKITDSKIKLAISHNDIGKIKRRNYNIFSKTKITNFLLLLTNIILSYFFYVINFINLPTYLFLTAFQIILSTLFLTKKTASLNTIIFLKVVFETYFIFLYDKDISISKLLIILNLVYFVINLFFYRYRIIRLLKIALIIEFFTFFLIIFNIFEQSSEIILKTLVVIFFLINLYLTHFLLKIKKIIFQFCISVFTFLYLGTFASEIFGSSFFFVIIFISLFSLLLSFIKKISFYINSNLILSGLITIFYLIEFNRDYFFISTGLFFIYLILSILYRNLKYIFHIGIFGLIINLFILSVDGLYNKNLSFVLMPISMLIFEIFLHRISHYKKITNSSKLYLTLLFISINISQVIGQNYLVTLIILLIKSFYFLSSKKKLGIFYLFFGITLSFILGSNLQLIFIILANIIYLRLFRKNLIYLPFYELKIKKLNIIPKFIFFSSFNFKKSYFFILSILISLIQFFSYPPSLTPTIIFFILSLLKLEISFKTSNNKVLVLKL